jgi:general secretion pathway protein G
VERSAKRSGFSLVEMMAVVVILGLVMSVVVVNVMKQVDWAKVETTKMKMRALEGALEMYELQNHDYPLTQPGLDSLVSAEEGRRGYVRDERDLEDAWRRRFEYASPGRERRYAYDLWSYGKDGASGGEGTNADIVNWRTDDPVSGDALRPD